MTIEGINDKDLQVGIDVAMREVLLGLGSEELDGLKVDVVHEIDFTRGRLITITFPGLKNRPIIQAELDGDQRGVYYLGDETAGQVDSVLN